MTANKVIKMIGAHKSTIVSLYLNAITEADKELVSLDEDGIIKIHNMETLMKTVDLSK